MHYATDRHPFAAADQTRNVLMVGAGLFFAGSKTGQAATQKASDVASDLSDEVVCRAREFGDQVGESASVAKSLRIGPV